MTISSIKASGRSFAVCATKRPGGFASAFLAVTIAGLVVPGSAMATEEWHVYAHEVDGMTGNQQLTNAFIQAQSGDTITIHEGTYNLSEEELIFPYSKEDGTALGTGTCLYSTADNLTVQGDPNTPREAIILSGADASGTSKYAIMRLEGANAVVRNLTFLKGKADSKGPIYWVKEKDKELMSGDGSSQYRRGGGLSLPNDGVCSNCVFDTCYALHGSGLSGGGEVVNCMFIRNSNNANNKGCAVYETDIIRDCIFEDNSRGAVRNCEQMISNCVFRANRHNWYQNTAVYGLLLFHKGSIVDCVFSNNTTVCIYLEKADFMPKEIRGCRFEDNTSLSPYETTAGIGGSVPCTTPVVGCTFIGENQINDFQAKISDCNFVRKKDCSKISVLSNCPQVEDSSFYSTLPLGTKSIEATVSVVTNCSLYRCHIHNFNIRHGYVIANCPRVENCLVERTVVWGTGRTFRYADGRDSIILNCTFVTNQSNVAFENVGSGLVTFKNTLFFRNNMGGKGFGKQDFNVSEEEKNGIFMDHCIYKSANELNGDSSQNWYGRSYNPLFLKDKYPNKTHEHPYALHRSSPCLDRGDNSVWTADDIDLAGNKRVNGIVDIGCYENWYVAPGLKVVIR